MYCVCVSVLERCRLSLALAGVGARPGLHDEKDVAIHAYFPMSHTLCMCADGKRCGTPSQFSTPRVFHNWEQN